MVALDFFRWRLTPLQARIYLVWFYIGDDDSGHFARGSTCNYNEAMLAHQLEVAMNEKDVMVSVLPAGVMHACDDEACHAILDSLPRTDARGLVPIIAQQGEVEAPNQDGAAPAALAGRDVTHVGGARSGVLPSLGDRQTICPLGAATDPRAKCACSPSPVVEVPSSSMSSPPSSLRPRPGDAGQGCLTVVGTGLSSGRPSSPKRLRLRWRLSTPGLRLGFMALYFFPHFGSFIGS